MAFLNEKYYGRDAYLYDMIVLDNYSLAFVDQQTWTFQWSSFKRGKILDSRYLYVWKVSP